MSEALLHCHISGREDAPTVLLGGALGSTLAMWWPQVEGLSDRLRLIAFDHRGHGASPAPAGPYTIADLGGDVLALMDRLEIERAGYAGLSLGGMVGLWLAANAPTRIDRLVAMCTSAYAPPAENWASRAAEVRKAGTAAVVAETIVERWFTPSWAAAHLDVVHAHEQMIASADAEGYACCAEAIGAMDLRPDLPRITASTLVISGAEDPSLPPPHQQAIAAAIPGARLESIEGAAHLANVEQAAAVNSLLAEHFGVAHV